MPWRPPLLLCQLGEVQLPVDDRGQTRPRSRGSDGARDRERGWVKQREVGRAGKPAGERGGLAVISMVNVCSYLEVYEFFIF